MTSSSVLVPALFLHIQKTAGTSVVHAAARHYGRSMTSHGECWERSPESLRDVAFISGHIGYDFARLFLPNRFSFTFLRDPVERVLSMYYFCRAQDPTAFKIYELANSLTLTEFLRAGFTDPWVKKSIWNNQVWQLAHGYGHLDNRTIDDFSERELLTLAMDHLEDLSFVGFTETFDDDCKFIFSCLGMPHEDRAERVNVTGNRPAADELCEADRQFIRQLTHLDQELYQYATTRFSSNNYVRPPDLAFS